MNSAQTGTPPVNSHEGLVYGFLGVLGFSFTLPATRMAVASLDPIIVGLGRALIAALLTRQTRPSVRQWQSIALVVIGVIVGFPMLTAWAMRLVPAAHGAVVLGLLPLATAIAGALRAHERPSAMFWLASTIGSCAVIAFALASNGGHFHPADIALLGAVALAALGYAEGARIARELGGWQVICWALLLAAPFLIVPVGLAIRAHGLEARASSWFGLVYVSVISMFLAFFAWYRGLATGGVSRVSQLQLLQPFLTLAFSALFLGERFGLGALACAGLVALSIFVSRRSRVTHVHPHTVRQPTLSTESPEPRTENS
jgi:drug/metabolite transporter (DMT)-like permease